MLFINIIYTDHVHAEIHSKILYQNMHISSDHLELNYTHSPCSVEEEVGVIERRFLWVVLEGEKDGVAEPCPAYESHRNESIASWTLIDI